jgi:predicted DCC family thiol-disulfide oxidoreductase YuxK
MTFKTHKPVVVYDGECNFCLAQIDRIHKMDKNSEFEYLARQDPTAETRFPVLRSIDFDKGMRLITPGNGNDAGHNYAGADALYQIARKLPAVAAIAWLYNVPGINQIAKAAYTWVAKNRSKLSGLSCNSGSCDIHKG